MTARVRPVDLAHPPALLGVEHAAAYLGVSRPTLLELDVPHVRIGTRRLYRRFDLDAWVMSLPAADEVARDEERCRADEAYS